MNHLDLPPVAALQGVVHLPASKSITIRALLLAALAEGHTELVPVLASDDARVMREALKALGVPVDDLDGNGARLRVHGAAVFPQREADIFVGNSGLSVRTLAAALAFSGGHYRLHGVPRMHERPIGDLVDALRALGANIRYENNEGYPPLLIAPANANALRVCKVKGDVSSQFLTGLLQAAPLAAREGDVVIEVEGELISKPYIEITLNFMARFGVNVERKGFQRFVIRKGSRYLAPRAPVQLEGDASSASYFLAAGVIGGGPVRVTGVGADSIQGDAKFAEVLRQIGGHIEYGDGWTQAARAPQVRLQAIDFDANAIPDAAMTLAVIALFCEGTTTIRNIASWRVKETDRLAAMATELRKVGAMVEEGADYICITPPEKLLPGASIDTYDDHRMAMCFSLVALGGVPVRINEPNCVAKTFPEYFSVFQRLAGLAG
ncbi:MAG: 3-phosphoshikimate 1-carboxyvinyltransferase [Pseudoxanthomonas sp.]